MNLSSIATPLTSRVASVQTKLGTAILPATRKVGRGRLLASKYAPDIMVGAGIVSLAGSIYFASKATLKASDVLEQAKTELNDIEFVRESFTEEKYSDEDYRRDTTIVYARSITELAKVYAPAIITAVGGITLILAGFGVLKRRNAALGLAYQAAAGMLEQYKKKFQEVVDVHPEVLETLDKTDPDGDIAANTWLNDASEHARYFDSHNSQWTRHWDYNVVFLKGQQRYANDKLRARGHIFLNEVYDLLGMERTPIGQLVGWLYDPKRSDGHVDFNLCGLRNQEMSLEVSTGAMPEDLSYLLLDFNVDGYIYEMI